MVLTPVEHSEISKQIKIYEVGVGTSGFEMAIQNRITRMASKFQAEFVSNFQIVKPFSFYLFVTQWKIEI